MHVDRKVRSCSSVDQTRGKINCQQQNIVHQRFYNVDIFGSNRHVGPQGRVSFHIVSRKHGIVMVWSQPLFRRRKGEP